MNIIDKVFDLMETDTWDTRQQAKRLTALYGTQDKDGQELLDQAFICLCGYSVKTLIEGKI